MVYLMVYTQTEQIGEGIVTEAAMALHTHIAKYGYLKHDIPT